MPTPSLDQLKRAVEIKEKIQKLEADLQTILGQGDGEIATTTPTAAKAAKPAKRKMSAAGRAAIRAAQKARWAKIKSGTAAKSETTPAANATTRKKRTMSPAARAKIAAAAKARWAKQKRQS